MFFDNNTIGALKKNTTLRAPPIPETNWRPPSDFPALWRASWLSVDVETFDPDLLTYGPGWGRKRGHMVGVSLATDGGRWYYPVRHRIQSEMNLEPTQVFGWLKQVLETPQIPKIGANLIYDIGWLTTENINVQGELYDVQFAEALLTENSKTALDYLGQKYCNEGKETNALYEWCAQAYGGKPDGSQRANIYRAPPSLVGPYAEMDAELPPRVLYQQWRHLQSEGLLDIFRLENDLIYPLIQMRLRGVRVDTDRAEQLYKEFGENILTLKDEMYQEYGIRVNINSPKDLTKLFQTVGLDIPTTEAGNPSFRKEFLDELEHPVGDQIRKIRSLELLRNTFIKSYILESNVNSAVYCQFHPLRGDDGGTRSGRFASSTPNLQNIPVRTTEGKKIRSIFIPDCGHICWEKDDYSQIEYRFLAHYATGNGSADLRARYNNDPTIDYHETTQTLVKEQTGKFVERKPLKNINFGLVYGMGEPKLARQIGIEMSEAKELFGAYHTGNPYVKATMQATSIEAGSQGYITTILGRRSRFDLWQPMQAKGDERKLALPYHAAIKMWGHQIKRAFLHKAINRRLQGSAADQMKMAIWRCWKDGIFNIIGFPKLTVHDELDFSVIGNSKEQNEAYEHMRYIMQTVIPLKVPVIVDSKRAINWGAAED